MTVASALERKVWVKMGKRKLYPSMYVLLIAGPGIGKTDALRNTREFLEELSDLKLAPTSVSRASLADELNGAARKIIRPGDMLGEITSFNSLTAVCEELGTFMNGYESEFMSTLNHLYDCVKYVEKKRSMKDAIILEAPQLNLFAATTPAWLSQTLPEHAWSEGFSSRLTMIFSAERIKIPLFAEIETDEALKVKLVHDLKDIHAMFGQFSFEEQVASLIQNWYDTDMAPTPDHPKLAHYLPRRHVHFVKLCIIMSAQRASDYIVRLEDFQEAQSLMLEAEERMPDVFKMMTYNSDSDIIDECHNFMWQTFARTKAPVSHELLVRWLLRRAPTYQVQSIIDGMIASGLIKVVSIGDKGRNMYAPAPRTD